jgi:hypothetical protein
VRINHEEDRDHEQKHMPCSFNRANLTGTKRLRNGDVPFKSHCDRYPYTRKEISEFKSQPVSKSVGTDGVCLYTRSVAHQTQSPTAKVPSLSVPFHFEQLNL